MLASLRSSIKIQADDEATVTAIIGKCSWDNTKLEDNIKALVNAVNAAKPPKADGFLY
jgi:ribosomal protein L1